MIQHKCSYKNVNYFQNGNNSKGGNLMKKLEDYKSGEYIKMNDYKAFIPSKINYNWGWDDAHWGRKSCADKIRNYRIQ